MAYDPADLARRFEPILYFAKGERFVPSDCKRYLERSALWNATLPRDEKTSWGKNGNAFPKKPLVARGALVGAAGEKGISVSAGQFIGDSQGGTFPFLFTKVRTGGDEGFLDPTGWKDADGVTKSSVNQFADIEQLATLYANVPNGGDPFLAKSRVWYHAEIFDAVRLRGLTQRPNEIRSLKDLFSTLTDPLLLCYYLFFPGHEEGIACFQDLAETEIFGNFAGDWACFAILLQGNGQQSNFQPVAAGLTSRNVGKISFLGDEKRVGMRIHDWSTLTRVSHDRGPGKAAGDHVRLFVAKGAHGLYPTAGDQKLPPFSPTDETREFCGAGELLGKSIEQLNREDIAANDRFADDPDVILAKIGFAGPIGAIWAGLELAFAGGNRFRADPETPTQFDHPPPEDKAGAFGTIIRPNDVDAPNDAGATVVGWPGPLTDEANLETTIDGRVYSMLVRRTDPDIAKRQIWWPPLEHFPGFTGRWGPRVARDPATRRAGMTFPEFWRLFMLAFAQFKAS